jgi:hypothetical protein
MFPPVSWVWPQAVNDKEANLLNSHEAGVGTLVRVLDGAKRTEEGRIGTIERTYGHPDYLAMEVRFEDGSVALYWYHELRRMGGRSEQEATSRW